MKLNLAKYITEIPKIFSLKGPCVVNVVIPKWDGLLL